MTDVPASVQVPVSAVIAPAETDRLVKTFMELCIDGRVALTTSAAKSVLSADLPVPIKRWFGKIPNETVLKLTATRPSYLVKYKMPPRSRGYTEVCALAVDGLPIARTWMTITGLRDAFPVSTNDEAMLNNSAAMTLPRPIDGYDLSLKKIGYGFVVAQVAMMSERQRSDALRVQADVLRRFEQKNKRK